MFKNKALIRLALLGSMVAWLILLFSDVTVLFSSMQGLQPDVPEWMPRLMLMAFVICLFYYYKLRVERDDSLNFTDLLWKVFATGLITTVISLVLRLLVFLLGRTALATNVIFSDFIYQINLALLVNFLLAALISWKRLILYQKSKWLLRTWLAFDAILFFILIYDTIGISVSDTLRILINLILGIMLITLSANMRWVAYLNFRQKWTSLLLLLLMFFYLAYFFYSVESGAETITKESTGFLDFRNHLFIILLALFISLYGIFSFLVILFNLPTSSVFEQKLEEVVNFQRISQSIQTEQDEESVYNILLESSVSSVFADAAWLEITAVNNDQKIYTYKISEQEAKNIREHLEKNNIRGVLDTGSEKTKNLSKHLALLKGSRFRSILAFPIIVKEETIGTLALLKELPDGFNKEMTRIVSTFANQAGISIENFRLMEEAFQNARYKEELKIAKTVQQSLLPAKLEQDPDFEVAAFSASADEVGGDYYDTLRIDNSKVALIIADVSGKGTTAAFHMSQMKGIFHSLAQEHLDPKEFMHRANNALTFCLERNSFISASFFVIDTEQKKIRYSRAGHCPVLFLQAGEKKSFYLKDKGAALGMVRNHNYRNHIETNEIPYQAGDIMVLYTDGITEAKNEKGEEFGNDRLAQALNEVASLSAKEIEDHLTKKLYDFTGTKNINDDYTSMTVRFKI
ncbi:MAG: Serine phosphatase RsbU, regulator of sigma subunit [Cytophagales bacterium]|jgi:serine phosphatase RsbU (regulator of sigma subunit)|nr:SpoIIE family protein phosphatase [Bacteroidota bacterium]MBS1979902.1 SpoIIE family protein phosphatase [Bacteroidota bacterium]WHZ07353.1 MAG: Serine phosphatase RsbU, regulator of sigma subunit [Cytophagales bacterium]